MASLITTIKGSQIDLPAFDVKTFVLHGRHFYSNSKTLRGARSGGAAEWILTSKIFHAYWSQCRRLRQRARTDASRLRAVPSFRAMSRSSEACFPSVAHSPAVRTQNLASQDQQKSAAGCVTCTPLLKSSEKNQKKTNTSGGNLTAF